jgi:acid phosphatase
MRVKGPSLVLIVSLALPGCAFWRRTPPQPPPPPPVSAPPPAPAAPAPLLRPADENLNAVLWTQTSVEYAASTIQAYKLAASRLDVALADPAWTAALEQSGEFSAKPPAVILDIDETALDNSAYQARLIEGGGEYGETTWQAWCNEAKADAVPGAAEFTRYADSKGVAVFYVSNRAHLVEPATRRNLEALRFALHPRADRLYLQGERTDWKMSDKSVRRRAVADEHRVLLLIGDDLGDFVGSRGTPEERHARLETYAKYWGDRWITIPNPMYGSWEASLFAFEYGLPHVEKIKQKRQHLEKKKE